MQRRRSGCRRATTPARPGRRPGSGIVASPPGVRTRSSPSDATAMRVMSWSDTCETRCGAGREDLGRRRSRRRGRPACRWSCRGRGRMPSPDHVEVSVDWQPRRAGAGAIRRPRPRCLPSPSSTSSAPLDTCGTTGAGSGFDCVPPNRQTAPAASRTTATAAMTARVALRRRSVCRSRARPAVASTSVRRSRSSTAAAMRVSRLMTTPPGPGRARRPARVGPG